MTPEQERVERDARWEAFLKLHDIEEDPYVSPGYWGWDMICQFFDAEYVTKIVTYGDRIAALEQLAEMVIEPSKVGVDINNDPFVWARALQERARELMEVKEVKDA